MANPDKTAMPKGIDVSSYDGVPDYAALKKDGVSFVIVRAGYGQGHEDPTAISNLLAAAQNSIPAGAYWFSYALTVEDAKREAADCIACLRGQKVELPVFYDFEYDTLRYAKEKGVNLGKKEYNAFAEAFLDAVTAAGYTPGIYYNPDFLLNFVSEELVKRKGYVRWLAHYVEKTTYPFDIWQSGSNRFEGENGSLDTDYLADRSLLPKPGKPPLKKIMLELTQLSGAAKAENPKSQVMTMQRLLRELGYPGKSGAPLAVDGSYGGDTEYAVKNFQKSKDIYPDGICGEKTWAALLL